MGRILIVEDSYHLVRLYQKAFREHEVVSVETAWSAIAILEKDHNFDLVILDMMLPEVSGMVVLQHIRKMPAGKDVNVFIVSADESLRKQAELVGIQEWMTKPVDIDQLLDDASYYFQSKRPADTA